MPGDLNMTGVIYIEVGEQGLDNIKPLWEKLKEHVKIRSTYFSKWFERRTFEQRMAELLKKSAGGKLHVDLAVDAEQYIGYCISSTFHGSGEIDSIFVEKSYRTSGIGGELMKRALAWMEREQAQSVRIAASVGNEEVLQFYQRYGFFPRMTLLELKKG